MLFLEEGQQIDRDDLLRTFVAMQYKRNDIAFTRGTFRVRGDTVEIIPVYEELAIRIEFFGDEIDRISTLHPLTGDVIGRQSQVHIFPASHYVAGPQRMERALSTIQQELDQRTAELRKQGKELEAQRLTMRTTYDLEMLSQVGVCPEWKTTQDISMAVSRARRRIRYWISSLTISYSSLTNRMLPCRRSAPCTKAMPVANARWSNMASVCLRRWTTDRSNGRNSLSASARRSTFPPLLAIMSLA